MNYLSPIFYTSVVLFALSCIWAGVSGKHFWNRYSLSFMVSLNMWRKEFRIILTVFIHPWWNIWVSTLYLLKKKFIWNRCLQIVHKIDLILNYKKATYTMLVLFDIILDYYVGPAFLCSFLKSSNVLRCVHLLNGVTRSSSWILIVLTLPSSVA